MARGWITSSTVDQATIGMPGGSRRRILLAGSTKSGWVKGEGGEGERGLGIPSPVCHSAGIWPSVAAVCSVSSCRLRSTRCLDSSGDDFQNTFSIRFLLGSTVDTFRATVGGLWNSQYLYVKVDSLCPRGTCAWQAPLGV